MDIKQEDLIKFWMWAGWDLRQQIVTDASGKTFNNRSAWYNGIETQFPDLTLNSIYQYAIPKLQDKGYQIDIVCFEHKGFQVAILDVCKNTDILVEIESDNPTEALYKAIMAVIDKG